MPPYTLDDYAAATAELEALNTKWEDYSGNNPNKYRADIEAARAKLNSIEIELKESGLVLRTATEERDALLDAAFPNAKSREVVEWQGKKYMCRFSPVSTSLSGKSVNAWHKYWKEIHE